ncbi:hypothetical protein DL767_010428 [Monosporascus sp. MG133]|nr:hypothetical protein DL767_010428 [Monosporascus sp. MG133]
MAPETTLMLGIVAATVENAVAGNLGFPRSIVLPGLESGTPIDPRQIRPAAISMSSDLSVSGAPWFDYETVQLTDEVLRSIGQSEPVANYAHLFAFDSGPTLPSGACRTFPGDAEWPSALEWDAFNALLGGALIPTVPLAAPCYGNWGVYDSARCAAVARNFRDPYFHEADPTSIHFPLWQGRTCLPIDRPNGTCELGAYPPYAVNVSTVAQIQLAINFARNSNLRLVIKNTGHCYLGKSSGAGALSVWLHNLKNVEYLPDYESDGYSGKALKVGAGVTVREVYQAAHEHGVSALGGICGSVGYAGGYITGGGHTPLSGLYGMAADQTLAFEVVTADGRFVTASSTSNPDLYWALRGGGGSTFGVVTSVVIKVHPKVPVTTSTFTLRSSATVSNETFWQGVRAYFELFIPFTDAGTYSYFWVYCENGSYRFEMEPFFAPNHTVASFERVAKPLFDRLAGLGIPVAPVTKHYDAFSPAFEEHWGTDQPAGRWTSMPGNRLFPRGSWEDAALFNATFDAIRRVGETWSNARRFGGYHQAPRNRAGADNAVSSAWRHAISFLIAGAAIPADATPAELRAAHERLVQDVLGPWREVAPASRGGGSYLNEAHVMESRWQEDFYGVHYPELLRLKRKWDPKSTFYATTAVGSEEWEVRTRGQGIQTQNGRLCRL